MTRTDELIIEELELLRQYLTGRQEVAQKHNPNRALAFSDVHEYITLRMEQIRSEYK